MDVLCLSIPPTVILDIFETDLHAQTLLAPMADFDPADCDLGHQLAGHENRRDGLSATDLSHGLPADGHAGAGRSAAVFEGAAAH